MAGWRTKLVVSDFHLGNGQFFEDGTVNPLEDFVYDDRFIEFLDHHSEEAGSGELELIINGDFMNMIQLLPEEMERGILTERAAVEKTEAIVRGHRELFDALRRFNERPNRKITYVMGNHDPGVLWPGVQDVLKRVIQGNLEFVLESYRKDRLHVEHGHQMEEIFRFDSRRYFLTKGVREPLLNLPWGVFFVKDYLYKLKQTRPYIDKIKPYGMYTRWAFYNDFWFGLLSTLRYVWFCLRTRFSSLPLKRAQALKGLFAYRQLKKSPTLSEEAGRILEEPDVNIVVFGHTHIPIHRRFGKQKEYLNPGCWNGVTSLSLDSLGFQRRLIYVRIDYPRDYPQARLLEWHGSPRLFEEVRA
ncbi:MAG: hypothetical protein D6806_18290 [Deltaproteobacteria bacterium]|nr:MAG: hypothetical protein D6806_18290 [Deltaproteobacteria bacterium]